MAGRQGADRPESAGSEDLGRGDREALYRDARVDSAVDETQLPRYYVPPQKPAREPARKPMTRGRFLLAAACVCLTCALLGGLAGGGLIAAVYHRSGAVLALPSDSPDDALAAPDSTSAPDGDAQEEKPVMAAADIYELACRQVVGITTEVTFQNFFGVPSSTAVTGSGFILSEDGYILTNYHVIEYAEQYQCQVRVMDHDGQVFAADLVGVEPENDLAVLQIAATDLTPVTLGDSDRLRVGDCVQPVGNPLGELDFTMTFGRVTAIDRQLSTSETMVPISMFQIDAAVNKGSSGGPVYNDAGEVVGVVTAKYADTGVEGLGFAIPINDAARIARELIVNGYVSGKAYLGAQVKTISRSAAMFYNTVEGVYVFSVDSGSPAETAGLRPGDVIYRIGSTEVFSENGYLAALRSCQVGDSVEIGVFRRGEALAIPVTLGEDAPKTSDAA